MATEEVMIAQNQGIGQKITQVAILLETQKEATITAINLAIPSAINLVEMIKHRVKDLHQVNSFERVPNSTKTRLIIKLSLKPLDTSAKGYQGPIPHSQVTEKSLNELKVSPKREGDQAQGEERKTNWRPNRGRRGDRTARFDRGRRNGPRRGGDYNREKDDTDYGRLRRPFRSGRYRDRRPPRRGSYRGDREGYAGKRDEAKSQNPPATIPEKNYWGD